MNSEERDCARNKYIFRGYVEDEVVYNGFSDG